MLVLKGASSLNATPALPNASGKNWIVTRSLKKKKEYIAPGILVSFNGRSSTNRSMLAQGMVIP